MSETHFLHFDSCEMKVSPNFTITLLNARFLVAYIFHHALSELDGNVRFEMTYIYRRMSTNLSGHLLVKSFPRALFKCDDAAGVVSEGLQHGLKFSPGILAL